MAMWNCKFKKEDDNFPHPSPSFHIWWGFLLLSFQTTPLLTTSGQKEGSNMLVLDWFTRRNCSYHFRKENELSMSKLPLQSRRNLSLKDPNTLPNHSGAIEEQMTGPPGEAKDSSKRGTEQ